MLTAESMDRAKLDEVERHLNITWQEEDTDNKVIGIMLDAEADLNHRLGAEMDYFAPGAAHRLFLDYCLYAWNNCIEELDEAYRAEILRIRHINEVKAYKEAGG